MLTCLSAKQAVYQKNEYILRAGDKNSCVMLLLEGGVCIVQEDFWGNRNIISKITPGEIFAEAFACVPGARLGVSVTAEMKSAVLFSTYAVSLRLAARPARSTAGSSKTLRPAWRRKTCA